MGFIYLKEMQKHTKTRALKRGQMNKTELKSLQQINQQSNSQLTVEQNETDLTSNKGDLNTGLHANVN